MTTFRPRLWLWTFRAIPLVVGVAWLYGLLFTNAFKHGAPLTPVQFILAPEAAFKDFGVLFFEMALVLLLGPYLLMVLILLPAFLISDHMRFTNIAAYVLFAFLTAGFGPCLWYLFSVDPILCRIAEGKSTFRTTRAA
jgi:hypothetical protein